MKKIGFLYGNEINFSQAVINKIKSDTSISDVIVEPITIGIFNNTSIPEYDVIFDRFSNTIPFYKSIMSYFNLMGTKVINSSYNWSVEEEFSTLFSLKKYNIKTPKTSIIPSKMLPAGTNGADMHNLQYPLDWDNMFNVIGMPANIKSNNSNDLFDCYRIYNKQDFFFIYDMSGTKTLLLQECIEAIQNIRIFVVNGKKMYMNYELHKAPKDRYSLFTETLSKGVSKEIDRITEIINTEFKLPMYMIDVVVNSKNEVYLVGISLFNMNIDNVCLPKVVYEWFVNETATMLIELLAQHTIKPVETQISKIKKEAVKPKTTDAEVKKIKKVAAKPKTTVKQKK